MSESREAWAGRAMYHGTDQAGAASILHDGVKIEKSGGGYFGRGFYLAADVALAESNYADMCDDGVVLKCQISQDAKIWDLRDPKAFTMWQSLERRVRGGVAALDFADHARRAGCDGVYDNSFQGVCVFNPGAISSVELVLRDVDRIQVSHDGATLWVHADDGSTVGRFSKQFGMDVHTTGRQQMDGAPQCLACTHEAPDATVWLEFCRLMKDHHGVEVPQDAMSFEDPTPCASDRY